MSHYYCIHCGQLTREAVTKCEWCGVTKARRAVNFNYNFYQAGAKGQQVFGIISLPHLVAMQGREVAHG